MDRLVERWPVRTPAAHRRNQSDRTCQGSGFVAQYIAEKIRREHYVKLRRAKQDLHCGVVDVEMIERDAGIFARNCRDRLAPKPRRGQNVGLVHAGQTPVTGRGAPESVTSDALDLRGGVFGDVAGPGFALLTLQFVLAEINISRQLTNDFEVAVHDPLGPEGGNSAR